MMDIILSVLGIWAVTGLWWVVKSGSRGLEADILFGALWPVYWYTDWRAGRWEWNALDALRLMLPGMITVAIIVLARAL
jgi:hypothetical protein